MTQLPSGWVEAPLGALASDISYGFTAKARAVGGDAQMLRITDIQDGAVDWKSVPYCDISAQELSRYCLQDGDLLFARTGATVGKTYLVRAVPPRVVFASYLIRVRPAKRDLSRYLSHFFGSHLYWEQISDFSAGIGQPNVNGSKLREVLAPVAPEPEQQRIADKLDTVLARVDACRDRLARVAPLLKRFRQSILAAATSGRLTEDWRLQNSGATSPRETTLGAVILDMRNGLSPKPRETPPGSRILRISSVRPGRIDFDDHRFLEVDPAVAALHELRSGDLLFTRYNGSLDFVGVCATVHNHQPGFVYPDKLIRVRVDPSLVLPKYIEIAFGSHSVRKQVEDFVKSSAGQKGISGGDLKTTRFVLPSLVEQAEIVRRVETLFAFADRLEARLAQAHTAVDRLTPSLLAKAFRGDLVPQDPADEPAAELLKRLAEQRAAVATEPGVRQSRRARVPRVPKKAAAMTKSRQDLDVMGQPYLAKHLRQLAVPASAEALFKLAELPVADFYKQLAWEVAQGHIKDNQTSLEPGHAA